MTNETDRSREFDDIQLELHNIRNHAFVLSDFLEGILNRDANVAAEYKRATGMDDVYSINERQSDAILYLAYDCERRIAVLEDRLAKFGPGEPDRCEEPALGRA